MIDLLRHGETTAPDTFCGSTNVPLSARGRTQMHDAVQQGGPWDVILSSPLQRCAEFARNFAAQSNTALMIDEGWRELHFGAWEGKSAAEISSGDATALARFWSNPWSVPPPHGGESTHDFAERVHDAWRSVLRLAERRVLIVTHGGVIRLLLCHTRGLPRTAMLQFDVPYASLHRALPAQCA